MSSVFTMQSNIADAIRRARLEGYKSNPTDILEHYRSEEEERKNYVGRPLLELVQNAEDAMAEAGDGCPCGLMVVYDGETLAVANHGKKFTDLGVQALCDRSKSPKRGHGFIGNKGLGFKAVLNWTDRPSVFSGDIAASFDRDRARFEILKALTPAQLVKLEHLDWSESQVPLLRLPFGASPDACSQRLLSAGWDTVLVLPINEPARAEVEKALADPVRTSLPFLLHVRRLDFLIGGKPSHCIVARTPQEDGTILVQIERSDRGRGGIPRYRLFRPEPLQLTPADAKEVGMSEVAIAYRKDAAESQDSAHSLHAFFPTLQPSPCPELLVHGTFLLTPDRNGLREDDPAYQDALSDSLAELLRGRVIPALVDDHGPEALRLLRFTPEPAETQRSLRRLWRALHDAVSESSFIPCTDDRSVRPCAARLWQWNYDALFAGATRPLPLVRNDWQAEQYAALLRALGARDLAPKEYFDGLAVLRPDTPEGAIAALEVVGRVLGREATWSELGRALRTQAATLTLWMTSSGGLRGLDDKCPLFHSLPHALRIPEWLQVHALHPVLAKWLDGLKGAEAEIWPNLETLVSERVHRFSADAFLEKVVCPQLEGMKGEFWHDHGYEVLQLIVALDQAAQDDDARANPDSLRAKLSALVRVPDASGNWQRARDIYAGTVWDGQFGERLAEKLADRYLLAPPEELRSSVPGLRREHLQYLGVSWQPKLIVQDEDVTIYTLDQLPNLAGISAGALDEDWRKYFDTVLQPRLEESDRELPNRVGRWTFAKFCGVEGLDAAAKSLASTTERLRLLFNIWSRLSLSGQYSVVERQGPQRGWRPSFSPEQADSFLAWQIKSARVFDVEDSCLLAERAISLGEAFLPPQDRSPWMKWLPILRIDVPDEREEKALEAFAIEFGSRSHLKRVTSEEWLRWLSTLRQRTASNGVVAEDGVKHFLHWMARALGEQSLAERRAGVSLPCHDANGAITFISTDRILISDDIQLDLLRQILVAAGHQLLVSDPADGRRLARIFGLEGKCLSKCLTVKRAINAKESASQEPVPRVLAHQAKILSLIEEVVGAEASERLVKQWPRVAVYEQLHCDVALDGTFLRSVRLPYRREGKSIEIDGENLWENCAAGLLKYLEVSPVHTDTLVVLFNKLAKEDASEVMRFLRARSVSEEDVHRWRMSLEESEPSPTAVVGAPAKAVPVSDPDAGKQKPPSSSQPPDVPRPVFDPSVTGGQIGSSRSPTGRTPTQPGSEAMPITGQQDRRSVVGSEAERWLEQLLGAGLPDGWEWQKGGGARPYDFQLNCEQTQVFVEAKADSRKFFLSEHEVQHAKENMGRYIVALVSDVDETPTVRWLWDPLTTCTVSGWELSGRVSFSETDYPGTVEPWKVPDVANVMPRTRRFAFAIQVPLNAGLPKGMAELADWLRKLKQS